MDQSRKEYLVMVVGGTLTMLSGGFIFPVFAPFVKREFVADIVLVGFAVSGYFIVRMFSEFPIGTLSDRIGIRKPLIVGRLVAIAGALICYQATEIWQLIVARALWGVGDAAFFCIGMSYVASLFSPDKRGRALGTFQAVETIGSLIGQSLGGFIGSAYGLRSNFLASTLIGVAALLSILTLRGGSGSSGRGPLLPSRKTFALVFNGTVIVACLINFLSMMRNNGLGSTLLPIYATEELKIPLTQYGLMVSASTLGSISGNFFGGIFSDRIGRKRTLALGFLIGGCSALLYSVISAFFHFIPVMFMDGLFWGIVYGTAPVLVADAVPDNARGMGIGIYRTFFDLGGIIGPIGFSSLVEFVGRPSGYNYAFYAGAALMMMDLLVISFLRNDVGKAKTIHS